MQSMPVSQVDSYINVWRNTSDQQLATNHVRDEHEKDPETITCNIKILKKCQSKLDCLIFEMLFIRELK